MKKEAQAIKRARPLYTRLKSPFNPKYVNRIPETRKYLASILIIKVGIKTWVKE
jgi:hypothetical protein